MNDDVDMASLALSRPLSSSSLHKASSPVKGFHASLEYTMREAAKVDTS